MNETFDNDGAADAVPSIPAPSKRIAMEWSLVLASQEIAATVNRTTAGWEVQVDGPNHERAEAILRDYLAENPRRPAPELPPEPGRLFAWSAWVWVFWMAAFYWWSMDRAPWCKDLGIVDSAAVRGGAWWRLFTAVTLHEDLRHFLSNMGTGFLLMGLAMARFGPGVGLLAAYVAGAAGNVAAVLLGSVPRYSLGASGMITGALGMVAAQSFAWDRHLPRAAIWLPRGLAAGALVLVLIGFEQGSDIPAHVGGFAAGAVLGFALARPQPAALQAPALNAAAGLVMAALVFGTWMLALRH